MSSSNASFIKWLIAAGDKYSKICIAVKIALSYESGGYPQTGPVVNTLKSIILSQEY